MTDCTPSEIIESVKVHNLADIDRSRRDAVTLLYAMNILSEGGNVIDLTQHLFLKDDVTRMREELRVAQENEKAMAESIALLNTLKAHSIKMGVGYHG